MFYTFNVLPCFIQCFLVFCLLYWVLLLCQITVAMYIWQVQHFLLNWINKPKSCWASSWLVKKIQHFFLWVWSINLSVDRYVIPAFIVSSVTPELVTLMKLCQFCPLNIDPNSDLPEYLATRCLSACCSPVLHEKQGIKAGDCEAHFHQRHLALVLNPSVWRREERKYMLT